MSRTATVPPDPSATQEQDNFGGKPYTKRPQPFNTGSEDAPSPRGRNRTLSRVPSSRASSERSRRSSPERTQSRHRPRARPRRRRRYSDEYSRSPSPRRRSPRDDDYRNVPAEIKPWFKKKTIWATVGTLAGIASVVATGISAQATNRSALATQQSAQATKQSAQATKQSASATKQSAQAAHRSADASTRMANLSEHSTRAVINTAVAAGHQDHRGRYIGAPPQSPGGRRGSSRDRRSDIGSYSSRVGGGGSNGRGNHRFGQGLLEYPPMAKVN